MAGKRVGKKEREVENRFRIELEREKRENLERQIIKDMRSFERERIVSKIFEREKIVRTLEEMEL